ncbi:GTP-binding protein ERG [Tripterygium wilfordii]|uniref:GTP-binding protein ERG n=1 Tax=Tripterygium wilfordii TaxID=458696 RepID=A0A7J7CWM2_TRIWF|nr:GTP-binding protein ERG [Tripterygium wilfordii]KAF5738497.1 GTP-binding protein ERG [Tripterygium wilfordii]
MKAWRALRPITARSSRPLKSPHLNPAAASLLSRFFSAQSQQNDTEVDDCSVFDSSQYAIPNTSSDTNTSKKESNWDVKYRERADTLVFGKETQKKKFTVEGEDEVSSRVLAKLLLEAALERADEEEEEEVGGVLVREENQKSLSVGMIGAPNAGKSALTNYMAGTKVSAVSRKTNTTTHEVLGVMTNGDTQICFFDTPGIMLKTSGFPSKDSKARVQSTWSTVELYDVLMVIFDVHRHLTRPDSRVVRLIQRMGAEAHQKQKRVLCMNKVDLVEKKKELLKVTEEFKDLPGYDRHFMISGLKGSGVQDLTQYLMKQAIKRPWDEDPFTMSEEVMKSISLEVVREKLLDHVHQEVPYGIKHRLTDWKELRDGSLRIEQHFITHKESQRKILVGKNGSKIGRIGVEANEELRSIFKREVHLILLVRVK